MYENECYEAYAIEELLCKEWDGAYPTALFSDDVLIDIGNFLYYMAEFSIQKVYSEYYWNPRRTVHCIRIVPKPS